MGTRRGEGKKQEEAYRKNADADRAKIVEDPLITARRNKINLFNQQVDSGTDIKDISALNPYYQLYEGAIGQQDADRQSTGGIFNLARGGNPAQANAYDTYMKYKRQQEAAGGLAQAFAATNADLNNETYDIGQMSDSRNANRAGLSQQAYSTYLNRPKQPSFLDRLMQVGGLAVGGAGAYFGRRS